MYATDEKLLIIDGDNKGKFGKYLYHDYDSGYYVPFVKLDSGIVVRPWEREVLSLVDLEATKEMLEVHLQTCYDDIEHFKEMENKLL